MPFFSGRDQQHDRSCSVDGSITPFPYRCHYIFVNSTKADNLTWCHKDRGQHLTNAQLSDCAHVLKVLQNRDAENVGDEAVFSWDPKIATSFKDNVYLLPQIVERGNCRAPMDLNGVKSVQALWGIDIWDSFGESIVACVVKCSLGGYTMAPQMGFGLRVTLKGISGDGKGVSCTSTAITDNVSTLLRPMNHSTS